MSGEVDELPLVCEGNSVSIDEMIKYVGEFKKFQGIVGIMLCVAFLPVASQVLIMYFAALNPKWRCTENSTQCISNDTFSPDNRLRCRLNRTEWEYTEAKEYSIVTYFDIYCDNTWLIDLSTSIIFIGSLCGSLLAGWVADTYGRRKTIYISTAMIILSGSLASFMTNVYLVILCRFVIGFFLCGTYQSAVLMSEIVASRYRPLAGTLIWCFFPISLSLMGLIAYFIRSWKTLFLACSAPYVFVILFYCFTPESPRWLRLHGKVEELKKMFEKMSKFNKKVIPLDLVISPAPNIKQKSNPLYLFRTCNLALITINTGFAGFVNALVYYGFSLTAGELGGSLYLNFILFSLSEIPASFCCIIFSDRIGRKKTTIIGVLSAGVSCILLIFLHKTLTTSRVVVGLLGKFFITMSFNSLGIWIVELYPTSLRSQAYSLGNFLCTIGSATSPWMITGLHSLHASGPYICMSVAALSCCLLLLFLKETKGIPTLECEVELRGKVTSYEERPFLQDEWPVAAEDAKSIESIESIT